MRIYRSFLVLLFIAFPVLASAGVDEDELPANAIWYLHVDLQQMRNSAAGRDVYKWLDGEVFVEFYDDVGIDLNKEVNSVTAFSAPGNGTIVIVKGPMSRDSQDKVLARARKDASVSELKHGRQTYFLVVDKEGRPQRKSRSNGALDDLDDGAFVSFALKDTLLVTGNEAQMKSLLDSKGKIAGSDAHKGALFVLTADKTFVQAGLDTDSVSNGGNDWNSNILRNTERAMLSISDYKGMIAVEAQLVSTDAAMAASLGGIANGLVALQAFNSELDDDIKSLIANTKINVKDKVLSVSTVIGADLVVDILSK